MTSTNRTEQERVPRRTVQEQLADWLRNARTCRSIALRYTIEAKQYEASGNRRLYLECNLEARNYWRRAWDYFSHARLCHRTVRSIANAA